MAPIDKKRQCKPTTRKRGNFNGVLLSVSYMGTVSSCLSGARRARLFPARLAQPIDEALDDGFVGAVHAIGGGGVAGSSVLLVGTRPHPRIVCPS